MSTYILLANYTEQGIKNVKESPSRLDAARELAGKYGVTIDDFYLTLGEYDLVARLDAPSDDAVARFLLAIGRLGNIRSKTLRAFSEQEFRTIADAVA
jgi:uncharacterized protein with GYD domain